MGIGVIQVDLGEGLYQCRTEGGVLKVGWCVDLTPCPVGATVAVADIYNWHYCQNILPVVNDEHPNGRKATTMWRPARELPAATCVMSYIRFARWQRECPTFYIGTLTAVDYAADTGDVELANPVASTVRLLRNVPIEYMTCNAGAFSPGDLVIVEFMHGSPQRPKVIGFRHHPKPCEYIIIRDIRRSYYGIGGVAYEYNDMEHPGQFPGYIGYTTTGDLFRLNPVSGQVSRITEGLYCRNHDIDTKGEWLIFNRYDHPGDDPAVSPTGMSIWKCRIDGSGLTKIVDRLYSKQYPDEVLTTWLHHPRWSKDCARITVPFSYWLYAWDAGESDPSRNWEYAGWDAGGVRVPSLSWKAQTSPLWNSPPTYTVFSARINTPPPGESPPFLRYMAHQGQSSPDLPAMRVTPWCKGSNDYHTAHNPVNPDRILLERSLPRGELMGLEDSVYLGAILEYDPSHPAANEDGLRVIKAVDPPWEDEGGNPTYDINYAWGYWAWPTYNTRGNRCAWDRRTDIIDEEMTSAIPGGIHVYDFDQESEIFYLGWGAQPCYFQGIYGQRPGA